MGPGLVPSRGAGGADGDQSHAAGVGAAADPARAGDREYLGWGKRTIAAQWRIPDRVFPVSAVLFPRIAGIRSELPQLWR